MSNSNYNPDLPDGPYNDPGACATESEACNEYARNVGAEFPDQEWLLTSFDSWERNLYYTGKPGRHPEDDYEEDVLAEGPTGATRDPDGCDDIGF